MVGLVIGWQMWDARHAGSPVASGGFVAAEHRSEARSPQNSTSAGESVDPPALTDFNDNRLDRSVSADASLASEEELVVIETCIATVLQMRAGPACDLEWSGDKLAQAGASVGWIATPFRNRCEIKWAVQLSDVCNAARSLRQSDREWLRYDWQLAEALERYRRLVNLGPPVSASSGQAAYKSEAVAFLEWYDSVRCEAWFRGGIVSTFAAGPLRPRAVQCADILPFTSSVRIGASMELHTIGITSYGGHPKLQAIAGSEVVWTYDLLGLESEIVAEVDAVSAEPCGWVVRCSTEGRTVMAYLNPSADLEFYFAPVN